LNAAGANTLADMLRWSVRHLPRQSEVGLRRRTHSAAPPTRTWGWRPARSSPCRRREGEEHLARLRARPGRIDSTARSGADRQDPYGRPTTGTVDLAERRPDVPDDRRLQRRDLDYAVQKQDVSSSRSASCRHRGRLIPAKYAGAAAPGANAAPGWSRCSRRRSSPAPTWASARAVPAARRHDAQRELSANKMQLQFRIADVSRRCA